MNGGLFANEDIEIPQFTDEIRNLLLEKASADFDWSDVYKRQYEKSFDYRGVELFNQRGCLILSDVEQMVFDEAETVSYTHLLVGKCSFARKNGFSLQIRIDHQNNGCIIVQVTNNRRHGFFTRKLDRKSVV